MKKILLITENFPPIDGGSSRWFWELYSRLHEFQVHVLTHELESQQELVIKSHMSLVRTPLRSKEWGIKSITGLKFYFKTFLFVRDYVRKHQIEEIHCGRVIHEGVIAWFVKLFTGVPYRCFVHGEDVETATTSREQYLLVQRVCRNATSLICNSENSANLVEKLGFEKKQKCCVLNPGVNTEKFLPAKSDRGLRSLMGWENKYVLLTVGRLQRRKGQDFFIKAMPEIIKTRPDLLYVIIGHGELEEELKQLIKTLELEKNVQLLTNVSDLQMIKSYQQCDGFILPNRSVGNDIEGFGMVLVEAQACGKAVIAGDSGGTKETMAIGKSGFIIDCSTPESIVQNITPLIINEHSDIAGTDKLSSCHKNARAHVERNLNWNAHVVKAKEHFIDGKSSDKKVNS